MSETTLPKQPFLGRFYATRFLGRGGMALVYLGQEPRSKDEVVIKVMQERFAADPKCREAFRREIDFMSQFRHPHAVALYEASLTDPQGPCLIMEYLNGIPLDDLLLKEKKLTPQRVAGMLAPLCMMLQCMHDRKYIHRDLKAGNVMVLNAGTRDETVKVLDFGLARKIMGKSVEPYIPIEKIKHYTEGTPAYMSPEQLSSAPMDGRGDLYSVGVLIYEMLTGRKPFDDDDIEKLLMAQHDQPPPPMNTPGISAKMETLVRECLAKRPEGRPKTARDLAMRFEDATGLKLWYEGVYESMLPADSPSPEAEEQDEAGGRAIMPQRDDTVFELEAWMPETIAVMKMGGFLHDIGGEVTESVPGMVRVYMKRPRAASKPAESGGGFLSSLFGKSKKADAAENVDLIEMEIHMAPHASGRSNHLHITLLMRVTGGMRKPPDWKPWCDKTVGDLCGYLMAKKM